MDPIPVHLDSRIACFNSTVDIPLYSEDATPISMVLIAPVVPIPTPSLGWKSIFNNSPSIYPLYVPIPVRLTYPCVIFVVNLPYSIISTVVPS